jgi:hypothetical protein
MPVEKGGILDWSLFDDEIFVNLAIDLLRKAGYSGTLHGDGSAGGVDCKSFLNLFSNPSYIIGVTNV